jgi:asparagine synthetase B (glutamine-hydrolysing)
MAEVLRHHQEDRLEHAYVSGSNLLIGRIGLAGHNPHPWPTRPDSSESGVHLFVSGPLLEREGSETIRQLPDGDAVRDWRGFFSAVLTEPVHRATLLLADRRASNPIYYIQTDDQLFFAPEVKALLPSLSVNKEIDLEALGTYLAQGYLLGDQTLFKAVRRLQGGELLRVENGKVVKETYWRFSPGSSPDGASQADLERELGQLLNAAARKHIGEPAKTIIFLSGGVDSRGILGGALAHVHGEGRKLNTVTWGVSQGIKDSDVAVAASIAHHFNTNHRFIQRKISDFRAHFTRASYLTDGLSDIFAFHPYEYQIMIEIRNSGYERVLRGDEIFGWSLSASTTEGAFALANLRRLRDVQGLDSVIQQRL